MRAVTVEVVILVDDEEAEDVESTMLHALTEQGETGTLKGWEAWDVTVTSDRECEEDID